MFQKGYQENKMTKGVIRKIKKYSGCFKSKKQKYGGF